MSAAEELAKTQAALAASQADLSRVERALRDADETHERTKEERAYARRAAKRFMDERDLARAELARIDEAAGRDIAKPDEPLVDRVADLLRGRTEATQRAIELATELAGARQEITRLRETRVDVARTDMTSPCGMCGGPIRRGHAAERIPTTDLWRHVACPDKDPS